MTLKFILLILLPFMFLFLFGDCKIIKTENGDIYECVNFYKQPALQHPSLKNHNFHPQMRPNSSPKRMKNKGFTKQILELDIRLKDGGCPHGTVPIRRTEKDDLSQFNLMKQNSNSSRANPNSEPGKIFALAQTKDDPTKAYNGVGAYITVYNPYVGHGQYSSAQVVIQDGSDMIKIGWTVNPTMYKDNASRIFVQSSTGDTHCLNSQCGFVIVSTEIALGVELAPVSTIGGDTYVYSFFVYQDEMNGNWWLELGSKNTIVGFWPQQFFSGMAHSASYAACGGEVYQPPGDPVSPQMGSGIRPYLHDFSKEAYCQQFMIVDDQHKVVYATGTQQFQNNREYLVNDNPDKNPEHYVFFGGPSWTGGKDPIKMMTRMRTEDDGQRRYGSCTQI